MTPDEKAEAVPVEEPEVLGREELATDLPEVFEREDAPVPEIYEQAKWAIQTCERVVRAKQYERSARALEGLGRMAEDHEIKRAARRLRLYASRKTGEILRSYKRDPEHNLPQNRRDKGARPPGGDRPTTQREAAEAAGLSKHQERQARRVAEVPVEEFVGAVESDNPPSLMEMAARGMKSRDAASPASGDEDPSASGSSSRASAAVTLREALEKFDWWCRVQDADELRAEFSDDELPEAAEKVGRIVQWLLRFCAREGETVDLPTAQEHVDENGAAPDETADADEGDASGGLADWERFFDDLDSRTDDGPAGGTGEGGARDE